MGDRLREKLLPILDAAVGSGQLTSTEAFAVLDALDAPTSPRTQDAPS